MSVVFKRKINPLTPSCRVSTPLWLVRHGWKIRLMERKALKFFLVFFLFVHVSIWPCARAKTNGSSGTYSASMHFPNHHICREKKCWVPLSVTGVRFVQSCVLHSSHRSDASVKPVMSRMKCGEHWDGMFYRMKGFRERTGNGKTAMMDCASLAVRCSLEVNQHV